MANCQTCLRLSSLAMAPMHDGNPKQNPEARFGPHNVADSVVARHPESLYLRLHPTSSEVILCWPDQRKRVRCIFVGGQVPAGHSIYLILSMRVVSLTANGFPGEDRFWTYNASICGQPTPGAPFDGDDNSDDDKGDDDNDDYQDLVDQVQYGGAQPHCMLSSLFSMPCPPAGNLGRV